MTCVHEESALLDRIIHGLLHPESPTSYNLIVPPGFGEDRLAEALAVKLRAHDQKPLVAVISADQIRNPDSYAHQLFKQWESCGVELPRPPSVDSFNRITQFFDLLPQGRPAIQVLTRFQKILDVFDISFLGDLRDRERAGIVRSVCISPYGYDELRQRWRYRRHIFCNSDYGLQHRVELTEPLDIDALTKNAEAGGVPASCAKLFASWTGGYPEAFDSVLNAWIRLGRPSLKPIFQVELRRELQKVLKRFVKWLDTDGQTVYRDAVLSMNVEPDQQEARMLLERHPWGRVLLKDGFLRTKELAYTVAAEYLQPTEGRTNINITDVGLWSKGVALYRGWSFALTKKLLEVRRDVGGIPTYLDILYTHAGVMTELYGGEAEAPMIACDWEKACRTLRSAEGQISSWRLNQEESERIKSRYAELLCFCQIVHEASKVDARVVDVLLGIRGTGMVPNRRAALILLAAHFAYDERIPGDTLACQAALPLLEQVFRAWAFVCLGVNYYAAPSGYEEVWTMVEPLFKSPLRRPKPDEEFPSFEAFAYFCVLLHQSTHPAKDDLRPESDRKTLESSLGVLQMRRDLAHSLAMVNPKLRRKYFEITGRWLDCLLRCDASVGKREALLGVVEPLPLLSPDGRIS